MTVTTRLPFYPIQPGVYPYINTSALEGPGGKPAQPIVAIVGPCLGGKPEEALYFQSPQALESVIRGGPAYDCARFALSASGYQVCVVRPGTPLQGKLELTGASAHPVVLTAKEYGSWTNAIQVTVLANNVVVIQYTDSTGVVYKETFEPGVSATAAQVVAAINEGTGGYPSQWVTAATATGTMPLTAASVKSLTGGTDESTPAAEAYTNALKVLEPEPISIVVGATPTASVHAQIQTHCDNLSQPLARHERTFVFGGETGETTGETITRATNLKDKRGQIVYPGGYDYSTSGALTLYAPFYMAARVAGMHCAQPDVATALTHQTIEIVAPERKLSSVQGSDLDQLLTAGVTPIAPSVTPGSYWLTDDRSTWTSTEYFQDFHKIRTADYVGQEARFQLEPKFVGSKILNGSVNDVKVAAEQFLESLQLEGIIRAWLPPTVTYVEPRTFLLGLPVLLPETLKFIPVQVALQPAATAGSSGSL